MYLTKEQIYSRDWRYCYQLTENMSVPLDNIISELRRGGEKSQLAMHLLCIFFNSKADNGRYKNHWGGELAKCIPQVPKVKKKNGKDRRPPAEWIYKYWWGDFDDQYDEWYDGWVEKLVTKKKDLDWTKAQTQEGKEDFHKFFVDAMMAFSEILSEKGVVETTDIE